MSGESNLLEFLLYGGNGPVGTRGTRSYSELGDWFKPGTHIGRRADNTFKGPGFLGTLERPDGYVSTEISIGVPINGRETEIPTIVPTLSKDELNYMLNIQPGDSIPDSIVEKAVRHAEERISRGLSPFYVPGEGGRPR